MRKALVSGAMALALVAWGTGTASADKEGDPNAFICVVVGDGVYNSPGGAGTLPSGDATFLPGENRAGDHANANALNDHGNGTPSPTNVPGADGFTPIWNPPNP